MTCCTINEPIQMPVCEHVVPVKFFCNKCHDVRDKYADDELRRALMPISKEHTSKTEIEKRVELLETMFNEIAKEVDLMTQSFGQLYHLTQSAAKAESLFASKVHDLKSIDKKRDDVINSLCQKVESLNNRFNLWLEPILSKT